MPFAATAGVPTLEEPVVLQVKVMRNATGEAWVSMMQLVTVTGAPKDRKCHYLIKQVGEVFIGQGMYDDQRIKRVLSAVAKSDRHPFKRITSATRSRLVTLGAERGEALATNKGSPPLVATAALVRAALMREGFAEEHLKQLELTTAVSVPHDTGEDTPLLGQPAVCTRSRRTLNRSSREQQPHDSPDDDGSEDGDYRPPTQGGSSSSDDDDDDALDERDPISTRMATLKRRTMPPLRDSPLSCQLPTQQEGLPRLHIRSKLALDPAREASQELQRQMNCFERFCKDPVVIGRAGPSVSTTTWNTCKQEISMFLGYCATHMDVLSPNLETVLDGKCLQSYFASRAQAKLQGNTLSKGVQVKFPFKLKPYMSCVREGRKHLFIYF